MKIGIIGMGVMGRIHHRVLLRFPDVQIVGVCDPITTTGIDAPWFTTAKELLATCKPDAVIIAAPTPLHLSIAQLCAEAGAAMLIEKPVAMDTVEAREIAAFVAAEGVRTAVGHVERFNPVIQSLKQALNGRKILSISFTRIGHMPPRATDVGILTDLSVHDIDLLRHLTGREIQATTICRSRQTQNHIDDNANLLFRLSGNVSASITTNWLTPFKKRMVAVAAEDAYLEANLIAQELVEYSAYRDDDSFLTKPRPVKKGEPVYNELAAFVEFVKTGVRGDLASIEDSLKTLEILENAQYIAETDAVP